MRLMSLGKPKCGGSVKLAEDRKKRLLFWTLQTVGDSFSTDTAPTVAISITLSVVKRIKKHAINFSLDNTTEIIPH